MLKQILLLSFLLLISHVSFSQNTKSDVKFPLPVGYVNDFEKVFSTKQKKCLEKIIDKHRKETTNQIVIVTVDSINPYTSVPEYTLDLFNTWGVGTKEKNNGIVILFGKKIRQISITVGLGLEKQLSNEECQQIINKLIVPEFKKDDYFTGIRKGLEEIIRKI